MAGTVDFVQTTASGAGAAVAVDRLASTDYQQVKLVVGSIGVSTPIDATTGIPGATMMGIVVAPIPGATVVVSGTTPVTGVVSVSGVVPVTTQASVSVSGLPVWWNLTAQVAITPTVLTVNTAPTVAGASVTIQQGASVIASIQNVTPVTTAASVSVSGVPVWLNPTQQVVVSGLVGVSITGSVNVVSTVLVTGLVGISGTGVVTLATGGSVTLVGTVGASIVAAVSLSGIVPVTTAASVSVSGLPVWFNPTQGMNVSTVSGTININLAAAGTTIPVNIVAGGAAPGTTATTQTNVTAQVVWLAPTQTIHVTIDAGAGGGGSVTTSAPSITASGQVMWVAGGQSTTVSPVFVSQINPPAGGGGSVTTAVPSISATGQIMFVVGGQSTTANPVFVSVLGGGTVTTILGTQVITLATGGSVTLVGSVGASIVAAVSLSGIVPVTTAVSVSISGLPVWMNPTQGVSVSTIPGTLAVSQVAAVSLSSIVPVTTAASVSVSGLPVWWSPTAQVVVSGFQGQSITGSVNVVSTVVVTGTIINSGISLTAGAPAVGATGQIAYIAGGQSSSAVPVYVTIANPLQGGYWLGAATTSAVSSSTQVLLMSVYNSTGSTLASSAWTIGAGSALMVYGLGFGWSQAAANNQATFMLLVTATGATISTAAAPAQAWAQVTFSTAAALSTVLSTGFVPGSLVATNTSITAMPFPWIIAGPAVVGVAVAATSSGATAFATMQASVVNTMEIVQPITALAPLPITSPNTLTVTIPGIVGVSVSSIVPVTTAASVSVSGLPVWLNPTQTVVVSNGTTVVSGTVSLSGLLFTTGIATVASTGAIVVAKDFARLPVVINITSTIAGASSMLLFTVQTGGTTGAGAAISIYPVPAGKVLRIIAANVYAVSSAVLGPAQLAIVLGTAAASVSLTATAGMAAVFPYAIQGTTAMFQFQDWANDIVGATTMGIAMSGTSHSILGAVIQGYLY